MKEHKSIAPPKRFRHSVIPHIIVRGAAKAIDFYVGAFGAKEIFRLVDEKGRILHAEIQIARSILMLGDAEGTLKHPDALGGTTVSLHVYVTDVDDVFSQAVKAGCKILQEVRNMFYGERAGRLIDPFGHIWVLLTPIEEVTPEEIASRAKKIASIRNI